MITLNILPFKEKKKIKLDFLNKKLRIFLIEILGRFILFAVILSLMLIFLSNYLKSEKELRAIESANFYTAKSKESKNNLISFNNKLDKVNNILSANKNYAPVLKELVKIMPEDVYLLSFSLREVSAPLNEETNEKTNEETTDKEKELKGSKIQITILGFSQTREKVLILEENLRSSSFFSNVQSPLSNLVKPENIDFRFTFDLTQL